MNKQNKNINTGSFWDIRYPIENINYKDVEFLVENKPDSEGNISDIKDYFFEKKDDSIKRKIMDLGGGLSLASERCRRIYPNGEFYSLDISKNAYQICLNSFKNITPILSDMENIPFEDKYFDCIFCIQSIEHCNDIEKVLFEINRTLKDNGDFLLTFPYKWEATYDHNYLLDDFFVENVLSNYFEIKEYKDSYQYRSKFVHCKKKEI